ncbi:MAG: radical SAM protein [Candidatus Scalindua sp.]|nr:radical SAM protein [Candidatus Scalindua sp.]
MVSEWPFVSVDMELTNKCMCDCLMCPREAISRPAGFMTEETFKTISDKLVKEGSLITFSGMGDPLLHPDIFDWIGTLRLSGADIGVVVNPASLTSHNSRKLVNASPNSITLSFPSIQERVFERLCPNVSFSDALKRAAKLIGLARGNVGLRIKGILTDRNRGETDQYVSFWKCLGVPSSMVACHGRGGKLKKPDIYNPKPFESESERCGLISFHTFVSWEGEVLACCHDLTGSTRIGSLITEEVHAIGERKESLHKMGSRPFFLCRTCDEPLRHCVLPQGLPPSGKRERNRFFRNVLRCPGNFS